MSITLACTVYSMEKRLEYLLDSGNTLNIFEIQKYWNNIFWKDGYLGHSQKSETKEPFSKMQINFTKVFEKK